MCFKERVRIYIFLVQLAEDFFPVANFVFPKMTFFYQPVPGTFLQCHKLVSKFHLDVFILALLYLKSWFNVDASYYYNAFLHFVFVCSSLLSFFKQIL